MIKVKVETLLSQDEDQLFIFSRKGGTLLVIDNYIYRSNFKYLGKELNKIYWECVYNRRTKCKSRLKTVGNELHVTNSVHNHGSDIDRVTQAKKEGTVIHKKFSEILETLS